MNEQKQKNLQEIRQLALDAAVELKSGEKADNLSSSTLGTYLSLLRLALDCDIARVDNPK